MGLKLSLILNRGASITLKSDWAMVLVGPTSKLNCDRVLVVAGL